MLGRAGGVDVEAITSEDDTIICGMEIDPVEGPSAWQLRGCIELLGCAEGYRPAYEALAHSLFKMARACDATLVEINPLVELSGGRPLALDARVTINSAALDRQSQIDAALRLQGSASPSTRSAPSPKVHQNPNGGAIGLIGLGGGLNITLMDWIADSGMQVGMLVDVDEYIGSGRAEEGFVQALSLFNAAPEIRSVLINIITIGWKTSLLRYSERSIEARETVPNRSRSIYAEMAWRRLKTCLMHLDGRTATR